MERTITADDHLPTKELLRRQRKADYEKAKACRKKERNERKEATRQDHLAAQAERQQVLWQMVRKASTLATEETD